ncbi:cupin domain-containing protein [Methylocystis sp. JAN1]|uniref:cupin domain-containing protein n=1 Tax=Methylocystis sp. JAN1 TaxID=3397211 RepID=UPI003FA2477F
MRSIALSFGALCVFGAAALAQTSGLRRADGLEWRPAPADLPKGAEVAVLYGDPMSSGPFVVRLRAKAGYQVPVHKHPDLETVTLISGAARYGEGSQSDPRAESFIHAGDFFAAPAGMGHWITLNEDAVLQVSGTGPWKIEYLDPRDKARIQQRGAALD